MTMIPSLALLLGLGFVWWLFRRDMGWRKLPSSALWIPGLWLTIIGSRQVSFWLGGGATDNLEGSPINAVFNGSLFLAAVVVLKRRNFSWTQFALRNKALIIIYSYFALSACWSQIPVPTFKRVIQDFGCVLTGLIILTEEDPSEALRSVFVRVSYLLFPLSVVFMRYFPDIGRNVSSVSGTHMLCGVTGHKNTLGQLTMVLSLVILWDILETRNSAWSPRTRIEQWTRPGVLMMGLYLLIICNSATSLVCFVLGVIVFVAGKRMARMRNARQFLIAAAIAVGCTLVVNEVFNVSGSILNALGRDTTLTGRTDIWRVIKQKNVNYLFGAGFRGFWETREGESVHQELQMNRLLTAHNGYLEAYLNGGLVGVVLLGALLMSAGRNAMNTLLNGDPLGRIGLMFWLIALIYNNAESDFFILEPLWFTWLLVTIDCPREPEIYELLPVPHGTAAAFPTHA